MADFSTIKEEIDARITTNGNQEITGAILNGVLDDMVDGINEAIEPLENDGYLYAGVVTPTSAAPTATGKVFVLASTAGTYTNFGNLVVNEGEVAILKYNGTAWSKEVTGIEKVSISQNTQTLHIGGVDTGIIAPEGYEFMGVVTPSSAAITPTRKVFVIANGKGTYTNFGGVEVTEDDVVVLYWDSSWHKMLMGIPTNKKIDDILSTIEIYKDVSNFSAGYIATNGAIGSIVDMSIIASSQTSHQILNCELGDKFIIAGSGGVAPRLWAFVDDDNVLISHAGSNAYSTDGITLIAPIKGKLIVHSTTSTTYKKVGIIVPLKDYTLNEIARMDEKDVTLDKKINDVAMVYDAPETSYSIGVFNATGTINTANKTNIVTTPKPIYVKNDGALKASDGYELRVFRYSDDSGFSAANFVSSTGYTRGLVQVHKGEFIGVTIRNITPTTQTDTSMSQKIEWEIPWGSIVDYIFMEKKSPKYKGELDIFPADINNWYGGLHPNYTNEGFTQNTNYARVIAAFDALMANSGGYVTKTSIGTAEGVDADGNAYTIYGYSFKPRRKVDGNNDRVVPKILLVGSMHGFEKCSTFGLYYFLYDIINKWTETGLLSALHNHVELQIVPVGNPWGFDRMIRNNANGINLNRNFPIEGWTPISPEEDPSDASGAAPLDQSEASAIYQWVQNNPDALCVFDCHTNGRYNAANYAEMNCCMPISGIDDSYYKHIYTAIVRHIEEQTARWSLYDNINPSFSTFCGKIQAGGIEGTLTRSVTTWLNTFIGMTLEGFNGLAEGDTTIISLFNETRSQVFKMNAENIGNMVAQAICIYASL